MTEHLNPDDDRTPLLDGWTAEGLLSQSQRRQECMAGTYFTSAPLPGPDNPEP